jgi:hypothetical protein
MQNVRSSPWRFWLPLLPLWALVLCLRGTAIWGRPYPTGPDYGAHAFYAELYLDQHKLPTDYPNFQLSQTQWTVMPGSSMTYAVLDAFSGHPVFELMAISLMYGLIEVTGVYLLAWRMFRRRDAALLAGMVAALLAFPSEMMLWANYPNLLALSLFPFVFMAWLDYWEKPDRTHLLLTALLIVGTLAMHHLSSIWLILCLGVFAIGSMAFKPVDSLKKLLPLGIVTLIIGLPIFLRIFDLWHTTTASSMVTNADRYANTKITWGNWSRLTNPVMLIMLLSGSVLFIRSSSIPKPSRLLIIAYALISLVFGFGWLLGVDFYYTRAVYFLSIPLALFAAAFFNQWRSRVICLSIATVVLINIAGVTLVRINTEADNFQALTPGVMESVTWLNTMTQEDDVILVGTFLGFQFPRIVQRPLMIGFPDDLVGSSAAAPVAQDALAVLEGDDNTDQIIDRYKVKYIVIRTNNNDRPDPRVSLEVLDANPRMQRVYENQDVVIYAVQ